MRVLKYGMKGDDVLAWEYFLRGQGYYWIEVNGVFEEATKEATESLQRDFGLRDDGEVGPATLTVARRLGFEEGLEVDEDDPPKPTTLRPLGSNDERAAVFGKFTFKPGSDGDAIIIDPRWVAANIVSVHIPQIVGFRSVQFHKSAADSAVELFAAWESAGLIDRVKSWAGSFVPRFQRGSRTKLSNHAWGTAFDINAPWNPLNTRPAARGQTGCVRELVPLANQLGWFWGGHFTNPKDGMHFEFTGRRP